ncbi:hypothetical protein COV49_00180 [Candidatus Falkowbacteria bacterium CG11_big_fil_rev_8_21_14_0_20_39_10]|uniref:Uncharacterized protein n=1 Tax=Candidatus Falkowbacteria bacterium CG11_big_fil_rev_8_21_14_0_20_39_10 TaxID=1974570 RepID=A0A2M6KAE4_9BACT|nr:MAG: hypothetical protein COV49_00180 [Candidatus Falkowbacteria bacterium CG11_big_fil_rev_8_21_14_0_20_39_10]
MGLREDKEQTKYYQERLNLENTNYNNLISRLQNSENDKKSTYKSSYENKLSNANLRLDEMTKVYNKAKTEREILKQDILEEIKSLSDSSKITNEVGEAEEETVIVKNWQLTQKFEGTKLNENIRTEKFSITNGEKLKIKYSYTPNNINNEHIFSFGFFSGILDNKSYDIYYELIANDIVPKGQTILNGEKIIYSKPNDIKYSFDILGNIADSGNWTIEVYEFLAENN